MAGYNTPLIDLNPKLEYYLNSSEIEGRGQQEIGLFWDQPNYDVDLSLRRYYTFDSDYIYGDNWSPGDINTMEMSFSRDFNFRYAKLDFDASIISSVWGSEYEFSKVSAESEFELLDLLGRSARLKLIMGSSKGEVPIEESFYLSSASPFEIWESPLYPSRGTLPDEWKDEDRLFKPGGGGLYGYYNRGLAGEKMLSAKLEGNLPRLKLPIRIPVFSNQLRRISPQVYAGSGLVWNRADEFSVCDFLSEAGLVFKYKIPYLDYLINENRINLYLPLWLSNPDDGEGNFAFRWLVGFTI